MNNYCHCCGEEIVADGTEDSDWAVFCESCKGDNDREEVNE